MKSAVVFIFTIVTLCQASNHGFHLNKEKSDVSLVKLLAKLQDKMDQKENAFINSNAHLRGVRSGIYWEDCSKSNDFGEVLSVSFNPDPPQTGASFKVTTKIQLYQEVTDGNIFVNIKYLGYITVLKKTINLCELAAESGESCPLAMGVHENYLEDDFPDFVLSGQYTGTIKAVDSDNNELSCISVKFSL